MAATCALPVEYHGIISRPRARKQLTQKITYLKILPITGELKNKKGVKI